MSDAAYEKARDPLLEVKDLRVTFRTRRGRVAAVDGLSFALAPGEVLGIVGESGSGKSVSMMSVLGLIRDPNATVEGQVLFRGEDLVAMRDRRSLRGRHIGMIFQDPMTSLTPVYTVGWHIIEQIRPTRTSPSARPRSARSPCSRRSASPTPIGASRTILTSSSAACASAW